MAVRPLPDPSQPVTDPATGKITQAWYEYFRSVGIAQLSDVSTTAPTNGQVLIYDSTTKKWTPGAN